MSSPPVLTPNTQQLQIAFHLFVNTKFTGPRPGGAVWYEPEECSVVSEGASTSLLPLQKVLRQKSSTDGISMFLGGSQFSSLGSVATIASSFASSHTSVRVPRWAANSTAASPSLPSSWFNIIRHFPSPALGHAVSFRLDDLFELRVPKLQITRKSGDKNANSARTSVATSACATSRDDATSVSTTVSSATQAQAPVNEHKRAFRKALPRLLSVDDAYFDHSASEGGEAEDDDETELPTPKVARPPNSFDHLTFHPIWVASRRADNTADPTHSARTLLLPSTTRRASSQPRLRILRETEGSSVEGAPASRLGSRLSESFLAGSMFTNRLDGRSKEGSVVDDSEDVKPKTKHEGCIGGDLGLAAQWNSSRTMASFPGLPHIKYDWTITKRLNFSCAMYYAKQFDNLRKRRGIEDVFVRPRRRARIG
ncbi:hypothetical protein R3P38DRAFT_3175552 [Favolaschia claudopus]|uniref:Uncharacterized protein n=1 Tax=Favolaschia claudopus TaxID=2862362 RepID=A0AAW0D384_9AGAR